MKSPPPPPLRGGGPPSPGRAAAKEGGDEEKVTCMSTARKGKGKERGGDKRRTRLARLKAMKVSQIKCREKKGN